MAKKYYLDENFRLHVEQNEGMTEWEDTQGFFNGKFDTYVEGFRVIPEGEQWKAPDGTIYSGFMLAAAVDFDTLEKAQSEQNDMREVMDTAGAMLTDEQAVVVPTLYRAWESGVDYAADERRLYNGTLYKCLQAHTAQDDWNPADAPSLWTKVLTSDTGEILPWEQPDSTNPYMTGDKVTHNGKTWVSDVDNNVWEPGVQGWSEVIDE